MAKGHSISTSWTTSLTTYYLKMMPKVMNTMIRSMICRGRVMDSTKSNSTYKHPSANHKRRRSRRRITWNQSLISRRPRRAVRGPSRSMSQSHQPELNIRILTDPWSYILIKNQLSLNSWARVSKVTELRSSTRWITRTSFMKRASKSRNRSISTSRIVQKWCKMLQMISKSSQLIWTTVLRKLLMSL